MLTAHVARLVAVDGWTPHLTSRAGFNELNEFVSWAVATVFVVGVVMVLIASLIHLAGSDRRDRSGEPRPPAVPRDPAPERATSEQQRQSADA